MAIIELLQSWGYRRASEQKRKKKKGRKTHSDFICWEIHVEASLKPFSDSQMHGGFSDSQNKKTNQTKKNENKNKE